MGAKEEVSQPDFARREPGHYVVYSVKGHVGWKVSGPYSEELAEWHLDDIVSFSMVEWGHIVIVGADDASE